MKRGQGLLDRMLDFHTQHQHVTIRSRKGAQSMAQENRYLSIPEVAQETHLSEAFWRKAVFHRRIAFVKMGKRVLIRRSDFDAWISARIVQAAGGPEGR